MLSYTGRLPSFVSNVYTRTLFGVLLISSLAQIQIPIKPVPVTLHTVGAILIALLYKPKEVIYVWASYLTLGAIGMPIFTAYSNGFEKLIGPSAGYYYGMVLGSYIAAKAKEIFSLELSKFFYIFILAIIVQSFTYILGVAVLANSIGIEKALVSGFLVFIPSGFAKSCILGLLFKTVYAKSN